MGFRNDNRYGFYSSAVILTGISAGVSLSAGALGAVVFKSDGYSGYAAIEAVKIGSVGGAIIGGALGLGRFSEKIENLSYKGILFIYGATTIANGMLGYAILNTSTSLQMSFNKATASFAVGGAILAIPVTYCLNKYARRRREQTQALHAARANMTARVKTSLGLFDMQTTINSVGADISISGIQEDNEDIDELESYNFSNARFKYNGGTV